MDTLKLSSLFQGPASSSPPPSLSLLVQGRFLSVLRLLRAVPGRKPLATGPRPQLWCFWIDPREGPCDRESVLDVKVDLCVLSPRVVWAQEEEETVFSLGC